MSWKESSDRGGACAETLRDLPEWLFCFVARIVFFEQCIIRIAGTDCDRCESSAKGGKDMLCFGTSGEEGSPAWLAIGFPSWRRAAPYSSLGEESCVA